MTNRARGEGALYEDKTRGRWIGELYDQAGKRHRCSDRTKTGCGKKLATLRQTVDGGGAPTAAAITVASQLASWYEGDERGASATTTYGWAVDRLTDVLGKTRLRNLTSPLQVEAALRDLMAGDTDHRPMGKSSLIRARSVLGMALDDAIRLGHIPGGINVARLAKLPKGAKAEAEGRSMTVDQARQFLAAIVDHPLGAMWTVQVGIGLRPGEAAGLTWEHVNLDTGAILVARAVRVEEDPDTGKNRAVLVDELKTDGSYRALLLPAFVVAALRQHQARQAADRAVAVDRGRRWDDDRLVFCTRFGSVLGPRNVARSMAAVTTALGMGAWTPNELRHTAASLMSKEGHLTDRQIADILGHMDTTMFKRQYNHGVGVVATAAAPMDALLG